MFKWIFDRSNRASGPVTMADYTIAAIRWLLGPTVLAWLSTNYDWYWQTFGLAGFAFAFVVAWLSLALGVFLIGHGMAAWRRAEAGATPLGEVPSEEAVTLGATAPELPDWLPQVRDELIQQGMRLDRFQGDLVTLRAESGASSKRLDAVAAQLDRLTDSVIRGHGAHSKHLDSIGSVIADLSQRLQAVENILRPDTQGLMGTLRDAEPDNRFKSIEAKIDITGRQIQDNYRILSTAIRARDAETMLNVRDAIVMDLGEKLLKADPTIYPDDAAWGEDYRRWRLALDQIDELVSQWAPHREPCLRSVDFETNTAAPRPVATSPKTAVYSDIRR